MMEVKQQQIISSLEEVKKYETKEILRKGMLIQKIIKRIIDICAAVIGIIMLIPITIIVYIIRMILKENTSPLFYDQLRIGKNGKYFKIYKFRTMVINADKKLNEYLEQNKEAKMEWEQKQKLTNDPRITRLGKFLRKTSIDEVPQFINVLKGDMSLVGPRPFLERELELMEDKAKIIHSVKPGITGYWAVNGRNHKTFKERVLLESYYAENFSLLLDIKIILKTITVVIRKEGSA